MNWRFWKKKKLIIPPYVPPKSIDDIMKETIFDEETLNRIDSFSVMGARLVCIKNFSYSVLLPYIFR